MAILDRISDQHAVIVPSKPVGIHQAPAPPGPPQAPQAPQAWRTAFAALGWPADVIDAVADAREFHGPKVLSEHHPHILAALAAGPRRPDANDTIAALARLAYGEPCTAPGGRRQVRWSICPVLEAELRREAYYYGGAMLSRK